MYLLASTFMFVNICFQNKKKNKIKNKKKMFYNKHINILLCHIKKKKMLSKISIVGYDTFS